MTKRYPCPIKFTDCFPISTANIPLIGSRRERTKGAMILKIHKLFRRSPLNSSHRKRLKPDIAFNFFIISLQVVANETRQKGQAILKFYERFL